MKTIQWENQNKMKIETGHKTFDKQCKIVSYGNVLSNTQRSSYIRPVNELECNGRVNPEGHLRKFDMDSFPNLPRNIDLWYRKWPEQKSILYWFYHYGKEKQKVTHGYVITNTSHKLLQKYNASGRLSSERILNECIKYVTNE